MGLTATQRISNLESALIAIQKRIDDLATDEEIFSLSDATEENIFNLNNAVTALEKQVKTLKETLDHIEAEQDEQEKRS